MAVIASSGLAMMVLVLPAKASGERWLRGPFRVLRWIALASRAPVFAGEI
jgi:hypothetical protein